MTAPISSGTPLGAITDGASSVDRPDQMDKDVFLKLLVAQMKYQDPSNPASSSDLMAQTATFSQVEQLENISSQNAALLSMQQSQSAVALVGQTVSYVDTQGETRSGVVQTVKMSGSSGGIETVIDGNTVEMGRITQVGKPAS